MAAHIHPHRCNAQLTDIINGIFDAPTALGTPLRAFFRCLRAAPRDPEYNVAGVEVWGAEAPPPPSGAPPASAGEAAAGEEAAALVATAGEGGDPAWSDAPVRGGEDAGRGQS